MTETDLDRLNRALAFPVRDRTLLRTVLTHRSFLNEPGGRGLECNERLEFLGDAVLGAAISALLYERFPERDEGALTALRARLVNRRTLARLARELGLGEYLLLGRGEAASGGARNPRNLAGVFEAYVAALFLEGGFSRVSKFVGLCMAPLLTGLEARPEYFDYKPALQRLAQKLFKATPVYRVVGEKGLPRKKVFEVEAAIGERTIARGRGTRKKDAEQEAAKKALEVLESEAAGKN